MNDAYRDPLKPRMTLQRRVVLEELLQSESHPSGDEVYRRARLRLPHISLGTVYRSLEVLSEAGLIRRLDFAGAPRRFDGRMSAHEHIRCLGCGKVDDIVVELPEGLGERAAAQTGYEVKEHRVELLGYCPRCRAGREHAEPSEHGSGKE